MANFGHLAVRSMSGIYGFKIDPFKSPRNLFFFYKFWGTKQGWLSQWPTFKRLGITYLIGQIKFELVFMVPWLHQKVFFDVYISFFSFEIPPSSTHLQNNLQATTVNYTIRGFPWKTWGEKIVSNWPWKFWMLMDNNLAKVSAKATWAVTKILLTSCQGSRTLLTGN